MSKTSLRFVDLFAGIGGFRWAIETELGGRCVFASEWDTHAQRTYFDNFGEAPFGDIRNVTESDIPDHEILTAGFPCQPFSLAGVSKANALGRAHGFEHATQGTLFFEIAKILRHKRPSAFILENVKHLRSHDGGRTFSTICRTLAALDYVFTVKIIDAKYWVPQHRERIFMVGFSDPSTAQRFTWPEVPQSRRATLGDLLEKEVSSKYTLSDKLWAYLQAYAAKHRAAGNGFGYGLADLGGHSRTLSARYYKDGAEILISQPRSNPRRLTPRECARLMGYPDGLVWSCSDNHIYRQLGNSVVVPVVTEIARSVALALSGAKPRSTSPQAEFYFPTELGVPDMPVSQI